MIAISQEPYSANKQRKNKQNITLNEQIQWLIQRNSIAMHVATPRFIIYFLSSFLCSFTNIVISKQRAGGLGAKMI